HPTKSATLIHNGTEKTSLMMFVGKEQANKEFSDVLSYDDERVVIDEEGFGDFTVNAQSAAIWIAV
ncbi:MAG: alpha-amylase, partial [Erysipelothrix sp.]|nr:alpha-amylase [Erysipelothrix sp.]